MPLPAFKFWVFGKLQSSLCFSLWSELGSSPSHCPAHSVSTRLRALVGGEPVGRDTLAAVNASSFLFERSDAAADEGYFIY